MKKADEILSELNHCTGTEHYYKNGLNQNALYTDGIKTMADLCGAYWFIDLVFSYQYGDVAKESFQLRTLEKQNDETWEVAMKTDSHQAPMVAQQIEHSDFPLDRFEVYFINGVMLLKSEY